MVIQLLLKILCLVENLTLFSVPNEIKNSPGIVTSDPIERDTKSLYATNVCFGTVPRFYPEECLGLETPTTKTLRIKILHSLSALSVAEFI